MKLICLIILILLVNTKPIIANNLTQRWQQYPHWEERPILNSNEDDLIYPDWLEGQWNVTSILREQIAPLAPKIVTPGFNSNSNYLDKPINFQVQFIPKLVTFKSAIIAKYGLVADRAFNGLNIGQAYLGTNLLNVKVDPNNPSRQITYLAGQKQLISTVIKRDSELVTKDNFIGSEITQQLFRSPSQIYLNEVETTTNYQLLNEHKITANQVTAIYLSPQDPNYLKTLGKPVALYYYQLELIKKE